MESSFKNLDAFVMTHLSIHFSLHLTFVMPVSKVPQLLSENELIATVIPDLKDKL